MFSALVGRLGHPDGRNRSWQPRPRGGLVAAMRSLVVLVVLLLASSARADQVQADLGLSVIAGAYEHKLSTRTAIAVEGGVFGSYFLPWFDLGDKTVGGIGGLRGTVFAQSDNRGLYITPYLRAGYTKGEDEDTGAKGGGAVITFGAFVGYVFRPLTSLDMRVGAGAQYIYIDGDNGVEASTPFIALDFTLGYKL